MSRSVQLTDAQMRLLLHHKADAETAMARYNLVLSGILAEELPCNVESVDFEKGVVILTAEEQEDA